MNDLKYISCARLKRDLRNALEEKPNITTAIRVIKSQPKADVIPVWFIKEYLEQQERGSVYQWALYALLGAWQMEKEKHVEE